MTTTIFCPNNGQAVDLIFTDEVATLPVIDQETMQRAIMNSSHLWMGIEDDKILAIWGLIPPTLLSDTAYLWLYTTKHLKGHSFVLVRHSQRIVQSMLETYPVIVGHALVGASHRSMQWLRWLGAEFGDPIDNKAIPFTIKAKQQWRQDSVQSA